MCVCWVGGDGDFQGSFNQYISPNHDFHIFCDVATKLINQIPDTLSKNFNRIVWSSSLVFEDIFPNHTLPEWTLVLIWLFAFNSLFKKIYKLLSKGKWLEIFICTMFKIHCNIWWIMFQKKSNLSINFDWWAQSICNIQMSQIWNKKHQWSIHAWMVFIIIA